MATEPSARILRSYAHGNKAGGSRGEQEGAADAPGGAGVAATRRGCPIVLDTQGKGATAPRRSIAATTDMKTTWVAPVGDGADPLSHRTAPNLRLDS